LAYAAHVDMRHVRQVAKVFCFFFSKKKTVLLFMTLTARILVALVLGLGIGAALTPGLLGPVRAVAPTVGGIWLDALRMTIVPLIFCLLVTGVATAAGTAAAGGLAARTLGLFAVLLISAALFSAVTMPALLAVFPIPAAASQALRAALGQAGQTPALPPLGDWVRSFIPTNPVGAAANGAMVPLVIFALIFGLAVTRIDASLRSHLVGVLEAVVQAMLVIVHWVLWAAPVGVFALALMVGAQAGLGAAGALAHYVGLVCLILIAIILLVYPLAVVGGGMSLGRFAKAAAAAQLVAFSTQSSIASLPAMVEAAQLRLGVPEHVSSLVLPLAVSLFRITSAAANMAVAVYVAALFGVHLGPLTLAGGVVVAAIVSLAAVGLPSQISFFTAIGPICLAMGVPVAALPLLMAVESLPDILRTVGNVTADIAVTGIAARWEARPGAARSCIVGKAPRPF
jgi:Na+/H+-dicarboxylate symporter